MRRLFRVAIPLMLLLIHTTIKAKESVQEQMVDMYQKMAIELREESPLTLLEGKETAPFNRVILRDYERILQEVADLKAYDEAEQIQKLEAIIADSKANLEISQETDKDSSEITASEAHFQLALIYYRKVWNPLPHYKSMALLYQEFGELDLSDDDYQQLLQEQEAVVEDQTLESSYSEKMFYHLRLAAESEPKANVFLISVYYMALSLEETHPIALEMTHQNPQAYFERLKGTAYEADAYYIAAQMMPIPANQHLDALTKIVDNFIIAYQKGSKEAYLELRLLELYGVLSISPNSQSVMIKELNLSKPIPKQICHYQDYRFKFFELYEANGCKESDFDVMYSVAMVRELMWAVLFMKEDPLIVYDYQMMHL